MPFLDTYESTRVADGFRPAIGHVAALGMPMVAVTSGLPRRCQLPAPCAADTISSPMMAFRRPTFRFAVIILKKGALRKKRHIFLA